MATTITIDGTAIDFGGDWQIDVPLSPAGVAPSATITTTPGASITAGDSVEISIDGTTIFKGRAESGGTIQQTGQRRLKATHAATSLFGEQVSISVASPTDEDVLNAALAASNSGSAFTLTYNGAATTLANDYDVDNRTVKRVFRDMMDRTSRVWWVDPASNTITVEPVGNRGRWNDIDTQADSAPLTEFDSGSVDSLRNDVTVVGTGDEKVTGTATDSTSISTYGRQSETINVSYITTKAEADAMAEELLITDPLAKGKLRVPKSVGDVTDPLVNYTVDVVDAGKGVDIDGLLVEKQTIRQGVAKLALGEGSGVSIANINRQSKSNDDVTEPGSVYNSDRLADQSVDSDQLVDASVIEQKLDDAAVATNKLQNNAVINGKLDDLAVSETKIQDDSISTPKLVAEAVTAAKIQADTITAAEIAAGTITALEIDADTITAAEIAAGTITALEIAADTLTANEIDVLDLDASQFTVSDDPSNPSYGFESDFQTNPDIVTLRPINDSWANLGSAAERWGFAYFQNMRASEGITVGSPGQASPTGGTAEFNPDGGDTTVFIGESGGATAIFPVSNDSGNVGVSGNYWNGMRSNAYFEESPIPTSETRSDVCLEELRECGWYDPPAYVSEGSRAKAADAEGGLENVADSGIELGHLSNYLLEVCKAQQERLDDLEARVAALEDGA